MLKKLLIIFSIIILLVGIGGIVFASDVHNATSNINGVQVLWEYNLNEANEIINLKCTNTEALTGDIEIPSTLDGKNVVELGSEAFKGATNITKVVIPNTVKEIGLWAFQGCTSLSKIDLGNVERIKDSSFKNCTSLTSVKLPKTLNKDASGAPFLGCTNLKEIVLEEGMTVVPDYVCASTPITEIKIPNTVKEIGLWAFKGCTSLSKIDLGNVERIKDSSFKNCTSLTSVKLPKTLNKDASGAPFLGCTNLKEIVLEEGMTVVPDYVCASTPITEIKIPNTVKEIGLWAFKDCTSLNKITILDNVENMEGYNSSNSDYIFQNHNDNLTIYCYKDSMAANYAIKYGIKYQYLTNQNPDGNNNNENNNNENNNNENNDNAGNNNNNGNNNQSNNGNLTNSITNTVDDTIAKGELPQTGVSVAITIFIIAIIVVAVIIYRKYNTFKDIK